MTKKKWLNKIIIYCFSPCIFFFYKLIYLSYRIRKDKISEKLALSPCIFVSFHKRFFPFAGFLSKQRLTLIISQSDDGELAGRVVKYLGWKCIIGSAGKQNALRATRTLIRTVKQGGRIGILADGPLGPASRVKSGVIVIASITGAPIIPISCGADRYWQFNSWDHYRIPKPFAKININALKPIYIPPHLDDRLREKYRKELEKKLILLDEKLDRNF